MSTAGEVRSLLDLGGRLADGSRRLPGLTGPRATCLVARQALQLVVADLLAARGLCPSGGSTRSRLICLSVAYEEQPAVGYRAGAAWARLSSGCHHHAYELAPTAGEVRALLEEVAWLHQVQDQESSTTSGRTAPG